MGKMLSASASTLALLLLVLSTLVAAGPSSRQGTSALRKKRDAYTDMRPVDTAVSLNSTGRRPVGAYARNFEVGGGSVFTWYSKSPSDASATAAIIITHGMLRDSAHYFTVSEISP
jgi:hypothetical protein